MKSTKIANGDTSDASQLDNLIDDARGASFLLVHQQSTPGMTLYVEPGVYRIGANRYIFAGGNTPSFTAPTSHPRIDIVTIDSSGTVAITQGTEASSPTAPAYPLNKLVLAEIYNRVGETSLHDTDPGGSNGYVYNDVRPFLGGAYISSDSQVDSGAAINFSKLNSGAVNTDLVPDGDGTRNLGSSGDEWSYIYAKNGVIVNGIALAGKFGGTGADGSLSISSGTTTINCSSASYIEKNYTSISITGTASLAFSSVNTSLGTCVVIRSQGAGTFTSSATRLIDLRSMGGGPSSGNTLSNTTGTYHGGVGGTGGSSCSGFGNVGGGASSQTNLSNPSPYTLLSPLNRAIAPGGNGSGGGGSYYGFGGGSGGGGGLGGGSLYLEIAGAYNCTGTFDASGANGGNGGSDGGGAGAGGGGGGGGGNILVLYGSLTADSGTYNVNGGSGGSPGGGTYSGGSGGSGANGIALRSINSYFA